MPDPADWFRRSPLPGAAYRLVAGWKRLTKPFRLGVRTLMFDDGGGVCLVRHSYRPGWYLPGGGVKRWETVADAAVRETEEEAGVQVLRLGALVRVYANFDIGYCDHVALFVVDAWAPAAHRSVEISEVRFFQPADLPVDATPPTRRRLQEWAGRATYADHW